MYMEYKLDTYTKFSYFKIFVFFLFVGLISETAVTILAKKMLRVIGHNLGKTYFKKRVLLVGFGYLFDLIVIQNVLIIVYTMLYRFYNILN